MKIAVDFDGTVVEHLYPEVGPDVPYAENVLKVLVSKGAKIILFTMRDGQHLIDAISWFELRNIPLYGHQKDPDQHTWTSSPKAYAQIYIDDAALGCPLRPSTKTGRPCVDWLKVAELFGITSDL